MEKSELSKKGLGQKGDELDDVYKEYHILFALIDSATAVVSRDGRNGELLSHALVEQEERFRESLKKYNVIDLS